MNDALPKKKRDDGGYLIVRRIPEELRKAFKAKCALEGVSQQDKLMELVKWYAKNG